MFEEAFTEILQNLFQKMEEEGILPHSFYEASVTLILEPDKDKKRRGNGRRRRGGKREGKGRGRKVLVSLMNSYAKIFNGILAYQSQQHMPLCPIKKRIAAKLHELLVPSISALVAKSCLAQGDTTPEAVPFGE